MRLKGKVALITGAGRGIGAQIGRLFAEEGATVVLISRGKQELERTNKRIEDAGGKACFMSWMFGSGIR